MELLVYGCFILGVVALSSSIEDDAEFFDELTRRKKQSAFRTRTESFYTFVEDQLIQHTQALEYITKLLIDQSLTSKKVNCIPATDRPISSQRPLKYRRHIEPTEKESQGNHILKVSSDIYKFGSLVKDLIMDEIIDHTEPKVIVDENKIGTFKGFEKKPDHRTPIVQNRRILLNNNYHN